MWSDVNVLKSSNANVLKYIFKKSDAIAESVLYKYPTYQDRTVICCSTQSGCGVGCRFCGAGDYFVRSLTDNEIVSQPVRLLLDACDEEKISSPMIKKLQIMFMSMGEPLLNLQNLTKALVKLSELYSNASLLISSIGPRINYEPFLDTCKRISTIGLQFSVHESTDEQRNKLIPFVNKLSLNEISKVGYKFYEETGRYPFFNYCVHNENNSNEDADRLVKLFDSTYWQATISVICERDETISVAHERQRELAETFRDKLRVRGFSTRVFDPAGQDDIGGGCGQLIQTQKWMKNNPDKAKPSVGYSLPVIHTPV